MKKFLLICLFLFLPLSVGYAYTGEEVAEHDVESDCWVIFDGGVYDLTDYLAEHDRYLDIRGWCGVDMTEDFQDKAGEGIDHKNSSYDLLENYRIGDLEEGSVVVMDNTEEEIQEEVSSSVKPKEYNLIIPLVVSFCLYWLFYFLAKKRVLGLNIVKFNGFFNSVLFLTLLIPAFGFGFFMILRGFYPSLYDIQFDFLYWHVELSLVMGMLGISHFIQRFSIYLKQLGR